MDATAVVLCRDHDLPLRVIDMSRRDAFPPGGHAERMKARWWRTCRKARNRLYRPLEGS